MPKRARPPQELIDALRYRTHAEVASELGVNERTMHRWLSGESVPRAAYITALGREIAHLSRPRQPDFTFIDLFAGIGGLRRGFEVLNGECLLTCERDPHASRTYRANFRDEHQIVGDIVTLDPALVPEHDVLLAGFPCQPFSLAGVSKKNSLGREHGFRDKAQGTLFFEVLRILEHRRPRAFLLENVKNLRGHDGGRTWAVIDGALRELGYQVKARVIDSQYWVPQRRERVFIVGFRKRVSFSFDEMAVPKEGPMLRSILHSADEEPERHYTKRIRGRTVVDDRYTLSDHLWEYLQTYAERHRALGNGFGCSVFGPDDVTRTLSARYHKDGSEILITQPGRNPRRLTPRECARLMGFDRPGSSPHVIPESISDTQAYRQFGNSVVVPIVEELAKLIVPRVLHPEKFPPKQKPQIELLATGAEG